MNCRLHYTEIRTQLHLVNGGKNMCALHFRLKKCRWDCCVMCLWSCSAVCWSQSMLAERCIGHWLTEAYGKTDRVYLWGKDQEMLSLATKMTDFGGGCMAPLLLKLLLYLNGSVCVYHISPISINVLINCGFQSFLCIKEFFLFLHCNSKSLSHGSLQEITIYWFKVENDRKLNTYDVLQAYIYYINDTQTAFYYPCHTNWSMSVKMN